jgi:periplasmic protein TonB
MKIKIICIAAALIVAITGCATNIGQSQIKEKFITEASYLKPMEFRYPDGARRVGQEGTVLLRILVLANGKIGQIEVAKSSGFEILDSYAKADIRFVEFIPAKTESGRTVDSWMIAPVVYKIK